MSNTDAYESNVLNAATGMQWRQVWGQTKGTLFQFALSEIPIKKNQNRVQHVSYKIIKKLTWISKLGIKTLFSLINSFEEEDSAHKDSTGAAAPGDPE